MVMRRDDVARWLLIASVAAGCGGSSSKGVGGEDSGGEGDGPDAADLDSAGADDASPDAALDDTGPDDTGTDDTDAADPCAGTDEAVAALKFYFVIHVEEDDADCTPGSSSHIPDFNGNPGVFAHFADAWYDYAAMLAEEGATLSFQPDWTFVEGVSTYRPEYFEELLALGNVEIVPHAHESCVPYEELYDRLVALGAAPPKFIGGMTFDEYATRAEWFADNPGWHFWNGPFGTPNHVDDAGTPPFVYRIRPPGEVTEVDELYTHVAASPLVAMPGTTWNPTKMQANRPEGRFLTTSWMLLPDRWFLAEPDDTTVPLKWRKKPAQPTEASPSGTANMSASEVIAWVRALVRDSYQPMVLAGDLEFTQLSTILSTYLEHESCLDLEDGQDLSGFVPAGP
jgi:hypothetical protein